MDPGSTSPDPPPGSTTKAEPRFSVVIPVFDGGAFVAETIASVQRQTIAAWEAIVVDDGSRDDTAAVIAGVRDPRVRLLRQPNAGVLAARRAGAETARASAIVFLDADDRLRPDALARFAAGLDRFPGAAVVYGDRVLAGRDGRLVGSEGDTPLNPRPSGDVLERLLSRNFLSTPGQACIRAEALADRGSWRTDLRRMTDWYLWCRIATRAPFAWLGRGPVVEYRVHRDSMARRFASDPCLPPSIDELVPAIDAVFALPEVAARFRAARAAALRRRCEASAYAWKGQELLRARRYAESRRYFAAALRRHPTKLVDALCFGLTVVGFVPPGVRRWVGMRDDLTAGSATTLPRPRSG